MKRGGWGVFILYFKADKPVMYRQQGHTFTCCVSQNPMFLPLLECHTLLLHHHSPWGVLH